MRSKIDYLLKLLLRFIRLYLILAIFADKVLQNTGTLLRRDTAQESEHDRFVHFKERILIADVRIHQQIELVAHEQIDNGEIHIITKNALLHALFEEVHCIFRAPVPVVLHQLISLGIFLDILKNFLFVA